MWSRADGIADRPHCRIGREGLSHGPKVFLTPYLSLGAVCIQQLQPRAAALRAVGRQAPGLAAAAGGGRQAGDGGPDAAAQVRRCRSAAPTPSSRAAMRRNRDRSRHAAYGRPPLRPTPAAEALLAGGAGAAARAEERLFRRSYAHEFGPQPRKALLAAARRAEAGASAGGGQGAQGGRRSRSSKAARSADIASTGYAPRLSRVGATHLKRSPQRSPLRQQRRGSGEPGSLRLDANFEGGNLGTVQRVSECEWDCEVRSDVGNPRHRLWFFFRVTNAAARQRVVINVTGFSKVSLAVEQKPGCCSRVSYSRGFQHSEVGFDH